MNRPFVPSLLAALILASTCAGQGYADAPASGSLASGSAGAGLSMGPGFALRYGPMELAPDFKLYADYQVDLSSGDNAFHVQRAYLGFKLKVLPWVGARITYDISKISDVGKAGEAPVSGGTADVPESSLQGSLAVRLKYAHLWIQEPWLGHRLSFGIVHTVWIPWVEHIEGTRFLRKVMVEQEFGYPSGDLGLALEGHLGQHLDYILGVYNGEGYHGLEDTRFKDLAARLSFRPAPGVAALSGLQVSGSLQVEMSTDEDRQTHRRFGGAITYRLARRILSVDCIKVEGDRLSLWVQVFYGQHGRPELLTGSLGLSAGGRLELPWRLFIIGRYDRFDPDLDLGNDHLQRVLAALGVRVTPDVALALDLQGTYRARGLRENLLGLHVLLRL